MYIKKLLLLLFLIPVLASAQKTTGPNYTYIAQRYEWLAGVFKALGLPAGDSAQFQAGQEMRAGAVYYDSVGVDSGLYVWSGLAWIEAGGYTDADARAAISLTTTGTSGAATYSSATGVFNIPDYTTTASEGITKVGSDFRLGHELGSSGSDLTTHREIGLNAKSIAFNSKTSPSSESIGYAHVSINVLDSLTSNTPPSSSLPGTAGRFERTIRVTGPYYAEYKNGFRSALIYEGADSVPIDTKGGDFGGGVVNELKLQPLATHTGRTVFTSRDGAGPLEAPFGGLSQLVVKGHSGASSYMRGYFAGHTSLFVMDSGQPDTLENFIHYGGRGYAPSPSKVLKSFFIRPTGLVGDSIWLLYDNSNYKSYLTGSVAIGGTTGTATASSLLDVTSTTKGVVWPRMTAAQRNAIASPATGLMVFDTDSTSYFQYNGSGWQNLYNTGGGSGPVNWGDLLGTLSDQTDLQAALDAKQNLLVNSAGLAAALSDETGTGLSVFNTTPTFTTNITTPLVIGGTSTTQTLTYKTTTGAGASGADHIWQVGNNGATEAMRILNSGFVGINRTAPIDRLDVSGGIRVSGSGTLTALANSFSLDNPAGFVRMNTFGPNSTTRGGFQIRQTSSTGTTVLTSFDLDANGDLNLTNLAGTGDRIVWASSTGKLSTKNFITLAEQTAPSTPASGFTAIYPKSDGLWYGKDDAGTETRLSNYIPPKNINLPTPGSAENEFIFFTDVAITVANTRAVLVGSSTPSVTYNIGFGTDRTSLTNVYTAGQTVTSTTTGTDASGVNDATIPANSWVVLTTSAQSGTVTAINVSVAYTVD